MAWFGAEAAHERRVRKALRAAGPDGDAARAGLGPDDVPVLGEIAATALDSQVGSAALAALAALGTPQAAIAAAGAVARGRQVALYSTDAAQGFLQAHPAAVAAAWPEATERGRERLAALLCATEEGRALLRAAVGGPGEEWRIPCADCGAEVYRLGVVPGLWPHRGGRDEWRADDHPELLVGDPAEGRTFGHRVPAKPDAAAAFAARDLAAFIRAQRYGMRFGCADHAAVWCEGRVTITGDSTTEDLGDGWSRHTSWKVAAYPCGHEAEIFRHVVAD